MNKILSPISISSFKKNCMKINILYLDSRLRNLLKAAFKDFLAVKFKEETTRFLSSCTSIQVSFFFLCFTDSYIYALLFFY